MKEEYIFTIKANFQMFTQAYELLSLPIVMLQY
jgi:hypothetical protein